VGKRGANTLGLTAEVTARFLAGVDSKLIGRAPVTSAFWPGLGGCGGVGPSGFWLPVWDLKALSMLARVSASKLGLTSPGGGGSEEAILGIKSRTRGKECESVKI
jgi:hypothetical protein